MIVIVRVVGETAIVTDEAGKRLVEVPASRVRPRFTTMEQKLDSERAGRLIGFFEATYEHGNLELGDRIQKTP